jgi:hypothetical protein
MIIQLRRASKLSESRNTKAQRAAHLREANPSSPLFSALVSIYAPFTKRKEV